MATNEIYIVVTGDFKGDRSNLSVHLSEEGADIHAQRNKNQTSYAEITYIEVWKRSRQATFRKVRTIPMCPDRFNSGGLR